MKTIKNILLFIFMPFVFLYEWISDICRYDWKQSCFSILTDWMMFAMIFLMWSFVMAPCCYGIYLLIDFYINYPVEFIFFLEIILGIVAFILIIPLILWISSKIINFIKNRV